MAEKESLIKRLDNYLSTSRNKSYFTVAVTVIFVVLVTLLGIVPAYRAVSFQRSENEKRDIVIAEFGDKLQDLKTLTAEEKDKQTVLEYFNYIFPNSYDQSEVIGHLDNMLRGNNLNLISANFIDNVALSRTLSQIYKVTDKVQFERINVFVEGRREGVLAFVQELEESPRLYNLQSVNIYKKSGIELRESEPGREYKANIIFDHYFYSE